MKSALFIALAFVLTACGPQSSNRLVVGMELAYPPFEMADDQGRPAGVSVDLAQDLGRYLGRDVDVENIPFDGLIVSLQTGKIDLIISSMTATPERARAIAFSDPYCATGLCLLVGTNSPVKSIDDLDSPSRTVAVKKGTTGHLYAEDRLKNARVLVLDKEDACVLEVVEGKADAFIYDQFSIYQNWSRNQGTTRALLQPFQKESWAIGLRQDDTNLLAQVNRFLAGYKKNGGFDRLGDRWLKEQKETFRKLGYPFYF